MGSTLCVLKALNEKTPFDRVLTNFTSVELYKSMLEIAKVNLSQFIGWQNFRILHGRIIGESHLSWLDLKTIDMKNDDHARLWLERDLSELRAAENILSEIPEKIDLLILDGGEYTTYPEYSILSRRSKFIIIDDTKTLKGSRIRSEVLGSNNRFVILDQVNDRNGWLLCVSTQ